MIMIYQCCSLDVLVANESRWAGTLTLTAPSKSWVKALIVHCQQSFCLCLYLDSHCLKINKPNSRQGFFCTKIFKPITHQPYLLKLGFIVLSYSPHFKLVRWSVLITPIGQRITIFIITLWSAMTKWWGEVEPLWPYFHLLFNEKWRIVSLLSLCHQSRRSILIPAVLLKMKHELILRQLMDLGPEKRPILNHLYLNKHTRMKISTLWGIKDPWCTTTITLAHRISPMTKHLPWILASTKGNSGAMTTLIDISWQVPMIKSLISRGLKFLR